nr:hypothetical protein [Tanacetum cinerariifolium]
MIQPEPEGSTQDNPLVSVEVLSEDENPARANIKQALGIIYEDLKKQKRVIRADEKYKFLNGSFKTIRDELHHRILDFCLGYNKEMSRRKWTTIDKRRSELMVELINKQMRERQIIRNLKRLVGARELEMDYRLMTRTE